MSKKIDPTGLHNLSTAEIAYIYQCAEGLNPFITSAMNLSVEVVRPAGKETETRVKLSLVGDEGQIEANGEGEDFYDAAFTANETLLRTLDVLRDQVMTQEERNLELTQSKNRVH